jgi:hypothetical protein
MTDNEKLKEIAHNIYSFCSKGGFELPADTHYFLPNGSIAIANELRNHICSFFDLDKDENGGTEKLFYKALCGTAQLLDEGFLLFSEEDKLLLGQYGITNSFVLNRLYEHTKDDNKLSHILTAQMMIVALNLTNFLDTTKNNMMPQEDFKKLELASTVYKKSIDAMGSLMCAQEAFTFCNTYIWRNKDQAIIDKHSSLISSLPKIEKNNLKNKEDAFSKWKPIVDDVKCMVETKKNQTIHTKHSASIIIAEKYNVKYKYLYNKMLDKYWDAETLDDL